MSFGKGTHSLISYNYMSICITTKKTRKKKTENIEETYQETCIQMQLASPKAVVNLCN